MSVNQFAESGRNDKMGLQSSHLRSRWSSIAQPGMLPLESGLRKGFYIYARRLIILALVTFVSLIAIGTAVSLAYISSSGKQLRISIIITFIFAVAFTTFLATLPALRILRHAIQRIWSTWASHLLFVVAATGTAVTWSMIKNFPSKFTALTIAIALVVSLIPTGLFARKVTKLRAMETASAAISNARLALTSAGQPLVTALGNVTAAYEPQDARTALAVLLDRAVILAHAEIARYSPGKKRVTFYRLESDGLTRQAYYGYTGADAPPRTFHYGHSDHDSDVIKFANSENAILVSDLENDRPAPLRNNKELSYKSFISVPVRAGGRSFGLLTADVDRTHALSEIDREDLILIAGVLGAGLAHVEALELKHVTLRRTPSFIPQQHRME
jgi:hypothetical protein